MIVSNKIIRQPVEDAEILFHTEPDKLPAPELKQAINCEQCRRQSPPGASVPAAIGAALAAGWKFEIPKQFHIVGFFDAEQLQLMDAACFCPRCASEFEP